MSRSVDNRKDSHASGISKVCRECIHFMSFGGDEGICKFALGGRGIIGGEHSANLCPVYFSKADSDCGRGNMK